MGLERLAILKNRKELVMNFTQVGDIGMYISSFDSEHLICVIDQ